MNKDTRRLKVFHLSEHLVLDLIFGACREWNGYSGVGLPVLKGVLPSDAILKQVVHDPFRKTFALLFSSDSFDEVPDGERFPEVTAGVDLEWRVYELKGIGPDTCLEVIER